MIKNDFEFVTIGGGDGNGVIPTSVLCATNFSQAEYGSDPSVNLATGRLKYSFADLGVGYGNYAVGLEHIYVSQQEQAFSGKTNGYGNGFKLNVTQAVTEQNGEILYLDSEGDAHRFVKFDANRYYDDRNAKTALVKNSGGYEITDGSGNKLIFNSQGVLTRSVSCQNAAMVKEYEYQNGRLIKIYDRRTVTSGKAKNRIELFYDAQGNLSSAVSYVSFNTKQFGLKYGYDKNSNLVSVTKVAYNKLGEEVLTREIIRMMYDSSNRLSLIADAQSKQASQILYGEGRVNKLSRGTVKDTCISVGATDSAQKSAANCGSTALGELTQTKFTGKSYQIFKYNFLNSSDRISYETDVTNENGITLAYFIDRNACITGNFEKQNGALKTLNKQGAKRTEQASGNGSGSINGITGSKQTGEKTLLSNAGFCIARSKSEQLLKEYGYSFWLKLSKCYNVAEIKLSYKFRHGTVSSNTVYVNGRAENAWQRVTLPLSVPQNTDNEEEMSPLDLLTVLPVTNKGACVDEYEIIEIGFAPMPRSELFLSGQYDLDVPLSKSEKISYSYLDESYNTKTSQTYINRDCYFTESDVIATFTNRHAHSYNKIGKTLYDVICNNGTKRIANVISLLFSTQNGGWSATSHIPFASKTVSSDGATEITAKYEFNSTSVTIETVGKRGEETSSTVTQADYKGKKLKETDEYGVTTDYSYNAYGDVTTVKVTASDGTVGGVQTYGYEDGKLVSANDGLSGAKTEYDFFDQVGKVTRQDGAGNSVGRSIKTEYGAHRDRPQSVAEYDGTKKVAENKVTYENGRLRTVSDGAAKYGVKYDAENNETAYTVFEGGSEHTVQKDSVSKFRYNDEDIWAQAHTSMFYDELGSEKESVTTEIDAYGRTVQLMRSNGANGRYDYGYDDSLPESKFASKPVRRTNYSKDEYTQYFYDADGNLVGWKDAQYAPTGNTEDLFAVRQISDNSTKYTFGTNEDYFAVTEYDVTKTLSPRVSGTKYSCDFNADYDNSSPLPFLDQNYAYDALGRVTNKDNDDFSHYVYSYVNKGSKSLVKTAEFKNYRDEDPFLYSQPVITLKENYGYTDKAQILQIKQDFSWQSFREMNTKQVAFNETKTFEYDGFNRITRERSEIDGKINAETSRRVTEKSYVYDGSGKLISVTQNDGKTFSYEYENGKLKKITDSAGLETAYSYDRYGNRKSKVSNGAETKYSYVHGNALCAVESPASSTTYEYDSNGVRCAKKTGNVTTRYRLDGNKILGEDIYYQNGKGTLRYFYDADGLVGLRYGGEYYLFVRDAQNNVAGIQYRNKRLAARYEYDTQGNCVVYDENGEINTSENFIGNVNPFRWKSLYYDKETNLYYANGSYYDPKTGSYVDASPIYTVFENALSPRSLDRNGLLCDNILELASSPYTIELVTELHYDPTYETGERKLQWWHWLLGGVLAIGSFIFAVATCGLTVAIAATLMGAAVGAAYGAFTAHIAGQDVLKGALVGMLAGIIMGNTAAAGTILMAKAPIVSFIASFGGGLAAGAYSELSNQINNYGKIVDGLGIFIFAMEYGIANTLSMLIGLTTVQEKDIMMIITSAWLFDVIMGGISSAIEVLKEGLKKK